MTFKTFAKIAAARRPDAVVHAHKKFGGVPDVAIYFISPDGRESRTYQYRGSYAYILGRLGIKVVTRDDIATVEENLRIASDAHGKPGLFGGIEDRSEDIARWTELLRLYWSSEYIRDWEWQT